METYLITYDLNSPGKDYKGLYEDIKQIGAWYHPLESVWFVKTNSKSQNIYDAIKKHIDKNDLVFVTKVSSERQGFMEKDFWNWL